MSKLPPPSHKGPGGGGRRTNYGENPTPPLKALRSAPENRIDHPEGNNGSQQNSGLVLDFPAPCLVLFLEKEVCCRIVLFNLLRNNKKAPKLPITVMLLVSLLSQVIV